MIYNFAITPDVFDPALLQEGRAEAVILKELLRGMMKNGLAANLQGGEWFGEVLRRCNSGESDPDTWDKVSHLLSRLHQLNRIVLHVRGSDNFVADEYQWLNWALECHRSDREGRFDGIIATDEVIYCSELSDDALVPLSTALDASCWTERRQLIRFEKTIANFKRHVAPVLRYSRKLTLIDPYLTPHEDRFFDSVEHCASLLGLHYGAAKKGLIDLHAGDASFNCVGGPQSAEARLADWKAKLVPVAKFHRQRVRVHLWRKKPGGKNLHDRFIITDQLGIAVTGGLDFGGTVASASLTDWALLEDEVRRKVLLEEYDPRKSPYQFLGMEEVVP